MGWDGPGPCGEWAAGGSTATDSGRWRERALTDVDGVTAGIGGARTSGGGTTRRVPWMDGPTLIFMAVAS